MSRRTERINDVLREELSTLLRDEAKDPRLVGLFSITYAEVAPDLKRARVYVSVLGTPEERALLFDGLRHVAPFLQHELRSRMRLRITPSLEFRHDDRIEEAARIVELMNEVAPPPTAKRRTGA